LLLCEFAALFGFCMYLQDFVTLRYFGILVFWYIGVGVGQNFGILGLRWFYCGTFGFCGFVILVNLRIW